MSRTSLSPLLSLALAVVALSSGAAMPAPELPPGIAAQLPQVKVQGGGELTFLGLSIYAAHLYRPGNARGEWSPDEPFALQLVYHRSLKGPLVAARSMEEMEKQGSCTAEQRVRWGETLAKILPDVDAGDQLTGVNLPKRGVQFYQNGKLIGSIDDSAFARAFFGIWLAPASSEPALRQQLLGITP
ncbi:MAG: chalcone isomerase family protein [Casimicrobiaceae bacterium]